MTRDIEPRNSLKPSALRMLPTCLAPDIGFLESESEKVLSLTTIDAIPVPVMLIPTIHGKHINDLPVKLKHFPERGMLLIGNRSHRFVDGKHLVIEVAYPRKLDVLVMGFFNHPFIRFHD